METNDFWLVYNELYEEKMMQKEWQNGIITDVTCIYILMDNNIYQFYEQNKQKNE